VYPCLVQKNGRIARALSGILVSLIFVAIVPVASADALSLSSQAPSTALKYAINYTLDTSFRVSSSSPASPAIFPMGMPSPSEVSTSIYHPQARCSSNSVFGGSPTGQEQEIDINTLTFTRMLTTSSSNGRVPKWQEGTETPQACSDATGWLSPLLSAVHIVRTGTFYEGHEAAFSITSFGLRETAVPTFRVEVVNDRVVSEDWYLVLRGEEMDKKGNPSGKNLEGQTKPVVISYSSFGSAPPVVAPPLKDIASG
jgi:hypothetical protein